MGSEMWRAAMERAYAANAAWRAEAEAAAGRLFRFEVGFTLPASVAKDVKVETYPDQDGLRIEVQFLGTEDARRKITDFIAELPTTCRSFRRYYDEGGGER